MTLFTKNSIVAGRLACALLVFVLTGAGLCGNALAETLYVKKIRHQIAGGGFGEIGCARHVERRRCGAGGQTGQEVLSGLRGGQDGLDFQIQTDGESAAGLGR